MRCKDVQQKLAIDAQISQLSAGARAHLIECAACRQAQMVYAGIDRELQDRPAWQPPSGFAERVAMQGHAWLSRVPMQRRRGFVRQIIGSPIAASPAPILLGLLAITFGVVVLLRANDFTAGCSEWTAAFNRAFLANASQAAWVTSLLSLGFTAWITRRALR